MVAANIARGLPLKADSFDSKFLSHTVEHIFDTEALLSECYWILKPGGRFWE